MVPDEITGIVPAADMVGEDQDDTVQLGQMLDEARSYLEGFRWCRLIHEEYFGFGVGGILAVFLFRIDHRDDVDEWLWVVTGDAPSAYFVTERAKKPWEALGIYCELMESWTEAVRSGRGVREEFPVAAEPSLENAALLEKRTQFIRAQLVPVCKSTLRTPL